VRSLRAVRGAMPEDMSGRIFLSFPLRRLWALWRDRVLGSLYLHRLGSSLVEFSTWDGGCPLLLFVVYELASNFLAFSRKITCIADDPKIYVIF
jgi:hypothetical protein